jgi:hypothetical protein
MSHDPITPGGRRPAGGSPRRATTSLGRYRITVRGRLSGRFAPAFDGLAVEPRADVTGLVGDIVDQAQLFGVLERVRDLGLELVSVEPLGP